MKELRIEEVRRGATRLPILRYAYTTPGHYRLEMRAAATGWSASLRYEAFRRPVEKRFESRLFEPYVESPRVFVARRGTVAAGWLETSFEAWNRRLRIAELLVSPRFRGRGIGSALIEKARSVAREAKARMIILETQSCNVPAIRFYMAHGFGLIGFDAAAYSNDDVDRAEIRLELGMPISYDAAP